MASNVYPLQSASSDLPGLDELVPATELSVHAQRLIDFAARRGRQPRDVTKQSIVNQFHSVFEMIGGVPRLALWADENPSQFFAMYSKLLPQVAKMEHLLPPPNADAIKQMTVEELKLLAHQYLDNLRDVTE